MIWSSTYTNLQQLGDQLLQNHQQHNLSGFQTKLNDITNNWNNLQQRYF